MTKKSPVINIGPLHFRINPHGSIKITLEITVLHQQYTKDVSIWKTLGNFGTIETYNQRESVVDTLDQTVFNYEYF